MKKLKTVLAAALMSLVLFAGSASADVVDDKVSTSPITTYGNDPGGGGV